MAKNNRKRGPDGIIGVAKSYRKIERIYEALWDLWVKPPYRQGDVLLAAKSLRKEAMSLSKEASILIRTHIPRREARG